MHLKSAIVKDTLAGRRLRLLAPLAILFALAALILAPGILTNGGTVLGAMPPLVLTAPLPAIPFTR
jgi:hypothetical protein